MTWLGILGFLLGLCSLISSRIRESNFDTAYRKQGRLIVFGIFMILVSLRWGFV